MNNGRCQIPQRAPSARLAGTGLNCSLETRKSEAVPAWLFLTTANEENHDERSQVCQTHPEGATLQALGAIRQKDVSEWNQREKDEEGEDIPPR